MARDAEVELTGRVVEFVRAGACEFDGARSPARWLVWRCGLGEGDARALVARARLLIRVPELAPGLAAGRLSLAAADLLAGAVTPDRVELARRDAGVLVDAAERCGDPGAFATVLRAWRALADDRLARADERAGR